MTKKLVFLLAALAAAAFAQGQFPQPVPVVASLIASSADCSTASSCASLLVRGAPSVGIQVTGTWVATLQFENSVDCTTWTGISPISNDLVSTTANGSWLVNTAGFCGVRARVSAFTSGTIVVTLRPSSGFYVPSAGCNQSAVVNVTAAATTQIVALSGTTRIRVCGFSVSMSAAGTAQWVQGTGANCGTGTANLTGVVTLATGTPWSVAAGQGAAFIGTPGAALCLAAVTGNVTGFLNYAQY